MSRIGQLLGGVLDLRKVLVAPAAFDLHGKRDTLEPGKNS